MPLRDAPCLLTSWCRPDPIRSQFTSQQKNAKLLENMPEGNDMYIDTWLAILISAHPFRIPSLEHAGPCTAHARLAEKQCS